MAEKDEKNEQPVPGAEAKALAALPPSGIPMGMNLYLDSEKMNQLFKVADMFSQSTIVPKAFQNQKGNCFLALELSGRLGMPAFAVMQNVAVVNGKPTFEAKIVSAMLNTCGKFEGEIEYEITGTDPSYNRTTNKPKDETYKVRAYATRKKDGKVLHGPWITWDMALGEGWVQKDGSKWKTMPEMMFLYRAVSYFAKIHATDVTFGMQTMEEMFDANVIDITPGAPGAPATRAERNRAKSGSILNGFDTAEDSATDQGGGAAPNEPEEEAGLTYQYTPETCPGHPLDACEDQGPGGYLCNFCGSIFDLPEGTPTIAEQKAIRAQELKESGAQEPLFK